MPFQAVLNNLALLLALSITYELIARKWRHDQLTVSIMAGLLFGLVAIAGMMNAFVLRPGVIFDGRTVVISVAGLFLGPITAGISAGIAAGYRLWLGGPGALTGLLAVLSSAVIGVGWFFFRRQKNLPVTAGNLLLFGFIVHAVLLLIMILTLPPPNHIDAVKIIAIPFLVILPLGTLVLGKLIDNQNSRLRTEKNLTESRENLGRNHALLTSLIDSIPDLIFYKDKESAYLGCNQAFTEFTGRRKEDIVGHTDFDLFSRDLAELFRDNDREMLASGTPRRNEEQLTYPNGRKVLLDTVKTPFRGPDGRILGLIGVSRDITLRKKSQEEKESAIERFQTLVDSLDALVYVADMETYELLFVNKYGREIWGDIAGKTCWQTLQVGQEGPCRFCTNDQLTDDNGNPMGVCLWEFQNTVNEEWYECRDQAIRWTDGRLVRMEIATNITKRKKAEQERQGLEAQLRQSQKMEALGTLAGGIAHDFNNILVPILGYTEMVMDTEPEGSRAKQDLREVLKAARRARDLVKQILTFSRQTEPELRPLLVAPVVKESLKLLAASLPSNIEMHQDIAAEESKILGDPTHISQIILNLCTNAYHAMMETGGILRVSLTEIDLTGEETWQDFPLAPGRYLRLSVSDTGKGMSPEVQAQIFEPYYTTKKIGEGTGLGLAVVHGIVTSCNGAIRVISSPGQGAIFQVYLPLLEGNGSPPDGVLLTEILPRGTERILLVDDEEPVLEATRRTLEYLGYQVTPQLSSTKALELFTNNPHRFDLVITDVTMPNLTGDHLAGNLRRIRPDIPVILCTGFSSMVDEARAKELQAYALLFKPLLRHDLAHMVRSALDSRKHRAGI